MFKKFTFGLMIIINSIYVMAQSVVGNKKVQSAVDHQKKGPDGLPIIFWKIKQEDQKGVEKLLDEGADIEAQGYHGGTPVLTAAKLDNWEMVEFLLKRGANPKAFDRTGFTIPWLTSQARPAPGSSTEISLNKVRHVLNNQAMLEKVYEPAAVRDLIKSGKWPL